MNDAVYENLKKSGALAKVKVVHRNKKISLILQAQLRSAVFQALHELDNGTEPNIPSESAKLLKSSEG
ncbi:hypothetical protein HDU96_008026 [Phlyctochytrium bullatum]|nr:hypothetical protein HDU96_008026 [Phlyctochytrium bullatum]